MQTALRLAPFSWFLVLCASCGSAPPPEPDPAIEKRFEEQERDAATQLARRKAFERVLNDTDRVLEQYAAAMLTSGAPKSDKLAETTETYLRRVVAENFARFMRAANDEGIPRNRAIALAALGMSSRREALDPLLNGVADPNPEVVANAVFGLGLLQDPRTPPSYLARIIENDENPKVLRAGAAWSLYRVQVVCSDTTKFEVIWARVLSVPLEEIEPSVAVSALRGIGQVDEGGERYVDTVVRYVSHPTPKVRQTAAVAIGRLGVTESYTSLIALIGPAESIANVRLAARKALQALAGGVDRGYEIEEWHRVFEQDG